MRRPFVILGGTIVIVGATACAVPLPADPTPLGRDGGPAVSDCAPPLAFAGETTLATIGLANVLDSPVDANRHARIEITRQAVAWDDFAPPGVAPEVASGQMLCLTWDDGSGITTLLHAPFGVGAAGDQAAADRAPDGGVPLEPLVAGVVALLVLIISWLAFRTERKATNR